MEEKLIQEATNELPTESRIKMREKGSEYYSSLEATDSSIFLPVRSPVHPVFPAVE